MTTITMILTALLFVIAFMLWFIWRQLEQCALALNVLASLAVHKHNNDGKEEVYTEKESW